MVKQFCKSVLQLEIEKSKSLANLVMGLVSQTNAKSVVETSLSRCYHFQHTSISKAIDSIYCKEKAKGDNGQMLSQQEVKKKIVFKSSLP